MFTPKKIEHPETSRKITADTKKDRLMGSLF